MHRRLSRKQKGRAYFPAAILGSMALAACQSDLSTSPSSPTNVGTTSGSGTNPVASTPTASSTNPLASFTFYIDRASKASQTADAWRSSRPADAQQMDKIASQPVARWFGNWNADIRGDVAAAVSSAGTEVPVFVAYNIPQRDCGGLSGGNNTSNESYRTWISDFAAGLGGSRAVVVLEPDALAAMDCLSSADQSNRFDLLKYAVTALNAAGHVSVYLDAGNARWQSASTMASRLASAGIATAAGFSLNVSNFFIDTDNVQFGTQVSSLIGGKHFIVDSGRNGLGPTSDNQWCNPEGRAIGRRPTAGTGNPLVDAYLWIKTPGESDGACNGYPSSGTWIPEYALGLAARG